MKTCFKCDVVKPFSEFYKHSGMFDGYMGKCKDCTKSDAKKTRLKNIEYYRKYDRDRGNRQPKDYCRKWREKYPNKYKAESAVYNAVRDGRLFRKQCEVCGNEKVHGHHDDYAKPLEVRWLCAAHHRQWHIENGEAKNADTNL